MTPYRSPWLDDELESFRDTVRRFVTDVLAPREPAWQASARVDAGFVARGRRDGHAALRRAGRSMAAAAARSRTIASCSRSSSTPA